MMVRLIPGDPSVIAAGFGADPEQVRYVRHALELNTSFKAQLGEYLGNLMRGDLGRSFVTREPVARIIGARSGPSLQLAMLAVVLVLVVSMSAGLVAGALTANGRHRRGELAFTAVTSVLGSISEVLAAALLVLIFAVWLRVLPVAGNEGWQNLVLPVLAIAIRPIASLTRIVRVQTLNVLAQDYLRTARSKRLPARTVYLRHVLPNVVTAALTVGGLIFANLIGGAVISETIFARPGLGSQLVAAVLTRDYPVIQGIVLVLGIVVVVINTAVDLAIGLIDPRSLTAQS